MNVGRHLKKLVKRLVLGNTKAFEQVVKAYYEGLFEYTLLHVKSEEVARGLVKKTFKIVWDNRKDLTPEDFQISLNKTINQLIFDHLREVANDDKLEEEFWRQIQLTRIPDPVWEEKEVPDEALPRTIHQTFLLGQLIPEFKIP